MSVLDSLFSSFPLSFVSLFFTSEIIFIVATRMADEGGGNPPPRNGV